MPGPAITRPSAARPQSPAGRQGWKAGPAAFREALAPGVRLAVLAALPVLAACDPSATGNRVQEAAARSVLVNVAQSVVPSSLAETAGFCLASAATPDETATLALDVGTRPGTRTYDIARTIASRPDAQTCLRERGVARFPL